MVNSQAKPLNSPVLIVDDDEAQLKTLTDILEMEDLQAICCQTGQQALAICQEQEINVAILDLRLPDIDGMQLLKDLKSHNPEIKVIINTAYASLESAMAAINQEAFAYVRKMGDVEELLAHIHRALYEHMATYSELLERKVQERTEALLRANGELKREISERQRIEEELRQAQKMEAIGRLAGGVAHDFNNILTAIIGNCDLILRRLDPDDKLYTDITQILRSGERAATLTRQLLTFSRQQVLQPVVLNLSTVVANMEDMLQRLIDETIVQSTILEPELSNIKADPGQIEQVIMNLVINARDAMPEGGQLTIETTNITLDEVYANQHNQLKAGPYVLLKISDTGVGIDAETESRIFEPFFTTKKDGTGLGLATVYGIINQSGGHIDVQSRPGQGTTFSIYLPQVSEDVPNVQSDPQDNFPAIQPALTILLAEDETVVREMTSRTLNWRGYNVLEAANGDEALRIAKQHDGPIHLLLTDVVMPGGMSGSQLAQRVVQHYPDIKVLYTSGYTDDSIVRFGVQALEHAFLQKPFTPAILLDKIYQVLKPTNTKLATSG